MVLDIPENRREEAQHSQNLSGCLPDGTRAVIVNSDQIEYLIEQGAELLDQGDMSGAEKCFSNVLEIDRDNAEACLLLGSIFGETGRMDDAVKLVRKSAELDPGNTSAHLTLGYIYHSTGHNDLAIRAFETAVECDAGDANAHLALANALLETNAEKGRQSYSAGNRAGPGPPAGMDHGGMGPSAGRRYRCRICGIP